MHSFQNILVYTGRTFKHPHRRFQVAFQGVLTNIRHASTTDTTLAPNTTSWEPLHSNLLWGPLQGGIVFLRNF